MKLTYNTRLIFENESDKDSILKVLSSQRMSFNECSKIAFDLKKLSIIDLHKHFYGNFRKSQEQIPSQVVISAERECLARYRSGRSNKHKKSLIKKTALSMQLDKRTYSIKGDKFSIVSLGKRIKCRPYIFDRIKEYWGKYKICDPNIFVRKGEIWISLIFDIPETIKKQSLATGIDLGVRKFAVSSEGVYYDDKKFKSEKRKLRHLKRQLQKNLQKVLVPPKNI